MSNLSTGSPIPYYRQAQSTKRRHRHARAFAILPNERNYAKAPLFIDAGFLGKASSCIVLYNVFASCSSVDSLPHTHYTH